MAYLLCIETATTNCSVALVNEEGLLAYKEDYDNNYSHAERLHVFIRDMLAEAKIDFADLSAIAVSKGPGSYTGLRIGVSAAKGLCYALDIPLLSVPTLKGLAKQITAGNGVIIPMIDARRMEVYSAIYDASTYEEIKETKAEILEPESYQRYLEKGKVYFIGNGVAKFKEICDHPNAEFILGKLPSAKEMAILGYDKFLNKDFEDVSYFDPYYLKDFVTN